MFGLSEDFARFRWSRRCPHCRERVGSEFRIYLHGTQIPRWKQENILLMDHASIARCPKCSAEWPVFAAADEYGSAAEGVQWQQLGEEVNGALGRAAQWAQRRATRPARQALDITAPTDSAGAKWSGLASALTGYAVAAAGIPGADDAINVLRALCGVEDAQAAMLSSIERQVQLLRAGPFLSGQLLLREAERVGPGDEEYMDFLTKAQDRFFDARGLVSSVQERALVEFQLGVVYALRDKQSSSERWLSQSYASASLVIQDLASQSQNIKVLSSRKAAVAATLSVYGGLYIVPAKLRKVWNAERAAAALRSFVPFVNCVAASLNAVSGGRSAEILVLTATADGSYELKQSSPAERN